MLIKSFLWFITKYDLGVREPVWGRRELVSHHGATGGGVRGPKMRHLVLYKLAGFFPTDWQPIGRELCPQKRCQKCAFSCTNWSKLHAFRLGKCKKGGFLQGGGATFWQAKNGGFWGPGSRARLVPRVAKTASQSPRGASSPSVFEEDVRFSRIGSYRKSNYVSLNRHSELSERPEACYFYIIN
jgi:hypothetical protein